MTDGSRKRVGPSLALRTLAGGLLLLSCASGEWTEGADRLTLEIREPVGISRRGYPVSAVVELATPVSPTTNFRLLHEGEPVVAQFRPERADDASARWWLDFATQLRPHEVRRYVIEYGEDVPRGPERPAGHKLRQTVENLVISNAPHIHWTVPRDLQSFLRSVDFPPSEHLRPDSDGLLVRDVAGRVHRLGGEGTTARIVREGTMAVALRFEKTETDAALGGVQWTVDLVFPVNVSWVELMLSLKDPRHRVAALGMQLRMNLDPANPGSSTLVDLGAAETVYTSLVKDQRIELVGMAAGSRQSHGDGGEEAFSWRVLRGTADHMEPFVVAPKESTTSAAGWAHLMDRQRCLAFAVHEFSRGTQDRITCVADGTFSMWRNWETRPSSPPPPERALRAWLHFVHYPPQSSAGASPQAMQHPIEAQVISVLARVPAPGR